MAERKDDDHDEALTMSGLIAGLALGFSVLAQALIREQLPDTDWRILIGGIGYASVSCW